MAEAWLPAPSGTPGKMKPAARAGSKFLSVLEANGLQHLLENAPRLNNAEITRQDSVDADIASVRQILDPRKFFENATPLLSDAGEDAR
jgi:hypothetical protein